MEHKNMRRFNHLEWWQWLLLMIIAVGGALLYVDLMSDPTDPVHVAHRGRIISGRCVIGLLAPYIMANILGYAARSRIVFLISLRWFSLGYLAMSVGVRE